MPLKRAAHIVAGQSPPSSLVSDFSGDELPFLQGNAEFGLVHPVPRRQCDAAPKRARPGDILLSVRAPVGALNTADQHYGIGRGLCAIRVGPDLDPRFGWWMAVATTPVLAAVATGSTFDAITADDVGTLQVPVPGRTTQRAIADFLDAETARIDALIAAKRSQRDLARERYVSWRQGVFLSIAGVRPLGLTARVLRGTTFPDRYQGNRAGDLPFVKVADFSRDGNATVVQDADNWITSSVARELKATIIPCGAVIFPRVGMAMMSNPRRIAGLELVMDDNQLALVLTEPGQPRYLFHWMLTVDLVAESNPGAVPSVTDASLRRLRIPWPSHDEQRHIADTFDLEATRVSDLHNVFEHSIALLRERRQALITAAVTGKLQVPETTTANAAA